MSTDVQAIPKDETPSEKQPRKRSKDLEKTQYRRTSNFQNKKYKHDKFRKRLQSFSGSNGKFFPPYKIRKKDFIIPPTKFLLGGTITDPLNLNSLQDEEINRAMNAVTPKSSPLPTPKHRRGEIEVIIPPDMSDPLNLAAGDDDATYEAMLTSPIKKSQKKQKKNKKPKRKNNRSSTGAGSGKEDTIEGAKLDETNPPACNEEQSEISESQSNETTNEEKTINPLKDQAQGPPPKRQKTDPRASLRKMELKERKADLDKIVSPVIPQPGAWKDRHHFRPPQRTPQINQSQPTPTFKESDSRFQYGNYTRYYGYRNPNQAVDVRLKVFEKHKCLFRGKDVLDIGCNSGHLTLSIARDFGPNKVVGLDIDRKLINMARTNIRHYVNCGKKDKFFPVSMPIVYGPLDFPGVSKDKAFPHNISFIQGNYVLDSDVQLSMEQPLFDVILCLSITKWIQLNWGDAGLKRAFKRMYAQLRPGGVLILEAQPFTSYQRKKKLTPEIWKNFHSIELFPHHFSQYLTSEVGFSRTEVLGSSLHQVKGFQRPIKLFIKEDSSFDTPLYSASTPRATPGHYNQSTGHFLGGDSSRDSNFAYGTPNSSESGFSEGMRPRFYDLPRRFVAALTGSNTAGTSHDQREFPTIIAEGVSVAPASTPRREISEDQETSLPTEEAKGCENNEDTKGEMKQECNNNLSVVETIEEDQLEVKELRPFLETEFIPITSPGELNVDNESPPMEDIVKEDKVPTTKNALQDSCTNDEASNITQESEVEDVARVMERRDNSVGDEDSHSEVTVDLPMAP